MRTLNPIKARVGSYLFKVHREEEHGRFNFISALPYLIYELLLLRLEDASSDRVPG